MEFIKIIQQELKKERTYFIGFFVVFLIWGIFGFFTSRVDVGLDRLMALLYITIIWKLHQRIGFPKSHLALLAGILILHHSQLYGSTYLGIPFDRIIHFTACAVLAYVLFFMLKKTVPAKCDCTPAIMAILIILGLGATLEVLEFVGYTYLAPGEGIFFYGTGDIGGYNNIGWDLIANMLGAFIGVISGKLMNMKSKKGIGDMMDFVKLIGILILSAVIIHFLYGQVMGH